MPVTIIFYFLILILLVTTTILLCLWTIGYWPKNQELWLPLGDGMKHALRDSGLHIPAQKSKVHYYRWIPGPDACDEAWTRVHWPSMDIVDWMKEGLPGTPEMKRKCGQDCQCRLMSAPREMKKHNPPGAI